MRTPLSLHTFIQEALSCWERSSLFWRLVTSQGVSWQVSVCWRYSTKKHYGSQACRCLGQYNGGYCLQKWADTFQMKHPKSSSCPLPAAHSYLALDPCSLGPGSSHWPSILEPPSSPDLPRWHISVALCHCELSRGPFPNSYRVLSWVPSDLTTLALIWISFHIFLLGLAKAPHAHWPSASSVHLLTPAVCLVSLC